MDMMDSINIILSYPIGTYMAKEERGTLHIDQIAEYIIIAGLLRPPVSF